nr:(Fe-S)-binding protein [Candidatus Sigynarchaeum springense]
MAETNNDRLKNLAQFKDAALSCAHCGQCRAVAWPSKGIDHLCPVYESGEAPNFEPFFSRGKNVILKGLLWGDLALNDDLSNLFYECTLCGACLDFCHNAHNNNIDFANHRWMDQVNVYEALRADLVDAGCGLAPHKQMVDALVKTGNPYGKERVEKKQWAGKLGFHVKDATVEPTDVLYFAGCTSALTTNPPLQNIPVAAAKVFHELGIDFSILGAKEPCCGSVALRTGHKRVFDAAADENARLLKVSKATRVVTSCAGCYRTLKKDYGSRLDGIEIMHLSEFLGDFLSRNKVPLRKLDITTTYHDPCHLGRHMNVYDAPRDILNRISTFTEMQCAREGAHCCGAGGGVKKAFPEMALAIARNRVTEATRTGAEYLVSTCPFCYRNLADGAIFLQNPIIVKDLTELMLEAIKSR